MTMSGPIKPKIATEVLTDAGKAAGAFYAQAALDRVPLPKKHHEVADRFVAAWPGSTIRFKANTDEANICLAAFTDGWMKGGGSPLVLVQNMRAAAAAASAPASPQAALAAEYAAVSAEIKAAVSRIASQQT